MYGVQEVPGMQFFLMAQISFDSHGEPLQGEDTCKKWEKKLWLSVTESDCKISDFSVAIY